MSDLPPYSWPRAVCAKCGWETASTQYVSRNEFASRPGYRFLNPFEVDRLERTCARCGYVWREACVASPKENPDGGV